MAMNVLFVASEVMPFAKTGGLADVVGVLPRYMAQLGCEVRVVMPRYYAIDREALGLRPIVARLDVPMGPLGTLRAAALEGTLPGSEVPITFIDYERFFGRSSLYTDPATGGGWADNDNRFAFLSRAALELCRALDLAPDLIHVHDWHSAAIPVMLDTLYRGDPRLGRAATVLTIHNLQHQGVYYPGLMDVLGVGWEHFHPKSLEFWGQVNLLKGGLRYATLLSTVSPRYADEIQTPAFGHGLDGVLRDRRRDLFGILNGCDYDTWDPATDPHIAANYSADDMSGKATCKAALQREMGLPIRPDVPLVAMVSRLVAQKGVDVIAEVLPHLLKRDVQCVILGTGERWTHHYFPALARRHPERFACRIGYDEGLAHRIEAGADLFLMPSRFEPCGLNQMYSLAYGTPPIVTAVGGLDDTVENFDEAAGTGTGFKLWDLHGQALLDTCLWAVRTWRERPEAFAGIVARGMAQRFDWERSAEGYLELYQRAIRRRTGRALV